MGSSILACERPSRLSIVRLSRLGSGLFGLHISHDFRLATRGTMNPEAKIGIFKGFTSSSYRTDSFRGSDAARKSDFYPKTPSWAEKTVPARLLEMITLLMPCHGRYT